MRLQNVTATFTTTGVVSVLEETNLKKRIYPFIGLLITTPCLYHGFTQSRKRLSSLIAGKFCPQICP